MGQSYFIECPKCDYSSSEITMGVGFLFGNIDDLLHGLKGKDKKTVQFLHSRKPSIIIIREATPSTSALYATPSKTSAILIYTTARGNSFFQRNPIVTLAKKIEITCQKI